MSKKYHIIGVSIALIVSVILGIYVIPNIASDTPQDMNENTTQTPNQIHSTVKINVFDKDTEEIIENSDNLKITLYNIETEESTTFDNKSTIKTDLEKGEYILSVEHPYYKNMTEEKITIKENTETYELYLERNKLTVEFSENITGTVALDGEEVTVSESSSVEFKDIQSGSYTLHIELDNGESMTKEVTVSGDKTYTIVFENNQ